MRPAIALALVALVLMGPSAGAQEAPAERERTTSIVTFYGHVFSSGLGTPMPANTQFPSGEDSLGLGVYHACVGEAPGAACADDESNKLVLFSTAGLVDVKSRTEFNNDGGYGRFHNERGSTKDVVLDTTQDVTAEVYMSLDLHAWSVGSGETNCFEETPRDVGCPYPYWGWDPGVWPQWTVEATLYYAILGEHGSAASEAPDVRPALQDGSAVVVANGRSAPRDVMNGLPGQPNVHLFEVNLGKPLVDSIPKEANFFMVYTWYSDVGGVQAATATWRLWTGEFFPAAFRVPVKNAFDVEYVVPRFVHEQLAILGVINTPWGSYDVDPDSIRLDVRSASGTAVEPVRVTTFVDGSVAHGAHYKPVNITYVWDYRADGVQPGTYTVSVSASNRQGSASASCEATVVIEAGGAAGAVTPGRCGLASVEESTLPPPAAPPASDGGGARVSTPLPLSVAVAGVAPAEAPPAAPVALVGLLALALFARLLRGWRS